MRMALTALVLCLLAAGCSDPAPATDDDVAATDSCAAAETIPIQGEGHLVGDQEPPVEYNSTPPTSGWHTSGDVEFAVYGTDEPLTEPEQVTVLELGGALITHRDLTEEDVATLAGLVTGDYAGHAAMTPYDRLEAGEVALTAWGKLQRCDAVDVDAVAAFIEAYAQPAG
jgi:hypothetical protein